MYGFTRSKTLVSPPTMKVSDAPSAPAFDPEHGASRKSMPCFASSAETLRLSEGDTVLQSTIVSAPERPLAKPSGPRIASVDILVLPTHRNTHSLRLATSAGVRSEEHTSE